MAQNTLLTLKSKGFILCNLSGHLSYPICHRLFVHILVNTLTEEMKSYLKYWMNKPAYPHICRNSELRDCKTVVNTSFPSHQRYILWQRKELTLSWWSKCIRGTLTLHVSRSLVCHLPPVVWFKETLLTKNVFLWYRLQRGVHLSFEAFNDVHILTNM